MRTLAAIGLTLSLSSLMTGIAIPLFLSATWLNEEVLRHYWQGDDDWLWLMLPSGGALGLVLGLRYRDRVWPHLCGVALLLFVGALIGWIWVSASTAPAGLAAGIGKLFAVAVTYTVAMTCLVSLAVSGIAVGFLVWRAGDQ